MRLHTENASEYVGRVLDSKKRRFHYYPLRVFKINENYFYCDKNHVMIIVPDKKDVSNSVYFDEVIK